MNTDIQKYNNVLSKSEKEICDLLMSDIDKNLVGSENKIWHSHPVWFLNGNPIVGYSKQKCGINLMFWSGQSFEEENLKTEGSFKAAQICYADINDINKSDLKRWLAKSSKIQWDYKNIVIRKGKLERII